MTWQALPSLLSWALLSAMHLCCFVLYSKSSSVNSDIHWFSGPADSPVTLSLVFRRHASWYQEWYQGLNDVVASSNKRSGIRNIHELPVSRAGESEYYDWLYSEMAVKVAHGDLAGLCGFAIPGNSASDTITVFRIVGRLRSCRTFDGGGGGSGVSPHVGGSLWDHVHIYAGNIVLGSSVI